MKREDFKTIIKCRSQWKIDRRKGDYLLPGNIMLSEYVEKLVDEQMSIDVLAIAKDGNLYRIIGHTIVIPYSENEEVKDIQLYIRKKNLVREIVGY